MYFQKLILITYVFESFFLKWTFGKTVLLWSRLATGIWWGSSNTFSAFTGLPDYHHNDCYATYRNVKTPLKARQYLKAVYFRLTFETKKCFRHQLR